MKPTAVVVNTSRGPRDRRVGARRRLGSGEIFAAGLDVFEREPEVEPRLLTLENVVVIPHLGSATVDTRNAMGDLVVDNVFAASTARPPTLLNPDAFGDDVGARPVGRRPGPSDAARAAARRQAAHDDARGRDRRAGGPGSSVTSRRSAVPRSRCAAVRPRPGDDAWSSSSGRSTARERSR